MLEVQHLGTPLLLFICIPLLFLQIYLPHSASNAAISIAHT